jgi:hypothetical protein
MTIRETQVDITPDKSLMPKMAQTGYSFVQAISELVDNSIDARLEGEALQVKVELKKESIQVMDDGTGMTEGEAARCLKLAHSTKKGKLGEFGLGLKTACLSLGRRFKIYTTTKQDAEKYILDFDEDKWMASSDIDWSHFPLKALKKEKPMSHGTTLKIDRLKVKAVGRTTNLRESLATRFAPFIRAGEVIVEVNGKRCKPIEPELTEEGKTSFEFDVFNIRVHGWYGLLKEGSQRGLYGFNTFKRGRLIESYAKIGFDEHPTVARVVGEIHMDDVPVTHNKREWMRESMEFRGVEETLRDTLKELIRKARMKASDEQVTRNVRDKTESWLDRISDAVRLPEIRTYVKPNVAISVATDERTDDESGPVKIMEIERRDPGNEIGTAEPTNSGARRTPVKTQEKPVHVIEIRGKRFRFTHEYRPLGANAAWKDYHLDTEKGLEIFTNTEFPAFLATNDKPYYAAYQVAESIAEVLVKEANEPSENADPLKQLILRRASELVTEVGANSTA